MNAGAIVAIDTVSITDRAELTRRLGGKGAGLAIMRQSLGLPVPPAFVIDSDLCHSIRSEGRSESFNQLLARHVEQMCAALGRTFGGERAPLLLSVRSSGELSMPGMMDTILNVGMNAATAEALASETGGEVFALDTWRRFCRLYALSVLGIPKEALGASTSNRDAASLRAEIDHVRSLAHARGRPIPEDPWAQLHDAIDAVTASWNSERAQAFRRHENISENSGASVVVQAMVFGNAGARSGTGVAFTRDPSTGENTPTGDFISNAQGEDVVDGGHQTLSLDRFGALLPDVHGELLGSLTRLERHFGDLCDVEFTVESGRLWILQSRIGRRGPAAAVRIAVEMALDPAFPLTRDEAVARVSAEQISAASQQALVDETATPLAVGVAASPGARAGVLCCKSESAAALAASGVAVVLARPTTSPDDVQGILASAALITSRGGMMSHAAVVARGWGVPAVTGIAEMEVSDDGIRIGERFLPSGAVLTIDGSTGRLFLDDRVAAQAATQPFIETLLEWARVSEARTYAEGSTKFAVADASSLDCLGLLRAIQLRGVASLQSLSEMLICPTETIAKAIEALGPLPIETMKAGVRLSAEGRRMLDDSLQVERSVADRTALNDIIVRFEPLDAAFKQLVTDWQLRPSSGGGGEEEAARNLASLVQSLDRIHTPIMRIVVEAALHAPRLARINHRLAHARDRIGAGDLAMLASPIRDSYHSIWFELHEELLHLSGRTRRDLEAAASG